MYTFRTILHPTDFSPYSQEAFKAAHALARGTGARLIVFHIAHPPAVVLEDGRVLSEPGKGEPRNLFEELQKIQATDPVVKVEHRVIVAEKSATTVQILQILERMGCDLIVMGTHGRTGLTRLIMGSVAEEVVRKAHCPVMVVKVPARSTQDPGKPSG
jgi:nucleotide-binding universal stress UspA family protein